MHLQHLCFFVMLVYAFTVLVFFSNDMWRCMHLQYFVVVGGTLSRIKRNYYDPCVTAYFHVLNCTPS